MKVLHSSDLHGKYKKLLACTLDFDVWLDTGDFLDNAGRKPSTNFAIVPDLERVHQAKLIHWKNLASRFTDWLGGRPAIILPGNHDFTNFGRHLQASGCPNIHLVTTSGVVVNGLTWSGFRDIPRMAGEWVGERDQRDFGPLVSAAMASRPDILVTHAPPRGYLDKNSQGEHEGIAALSEALSQTQGVQYHFFGHTHFQGGKTLKAGGTTYINGATKVTLHSLDIDGPQ